MGNIANSLTKRGKHAEAYQWFTRALEADPAHPVIHANLGIHLMTGGKLADGLGHLKQAVELDPSFEQGYRILARACRTTGHPEEADSYERLADLFSRNPGRAGEPGSRAMPPTRTNVQADAGGMGRGG